MGGSSFVIYSWSSCENADFSDVDLHGTTLTLSDLKGSNLNGIDLTDTLSDRVNFKNRS